MDTLARGLLYTAGIAITSRGRPDRAMHIRARAGANIVHLFISCCAILLFQVAHAGDLFYFSPRRTVVELRHISRILYSSVGFGGGEATLKYTFFVRRCERSVSQRRTKGNSLGGS